MSDADFSNSQGNGAVLALQFCEPSTKYPLGLSRTTVTLPQARTGYRRFLKQETTGQTLHWKEWKRGDPEVLHQETRQVVADVRMEAFEELFRFDGIKQEKEWAYDLKLPIWVEIVDPEKLLGGGAADRVSPAYPMARETFAIWLEERIQAVLADRLSGTTVTSLRDKTQTPLQAWNGFLAGLAEGFGVKLSVQSLDGCQFWCEQEQENLRRKIEKDKEEAQRHYEESKRAAAALEEEIAHAKAIQDDARRLEREQSQFTLLKEKAKQATELARWKWELATQESRIRDEKEECEFRANERKRRNLIAEKDAELRVAEIDHKIEELRRKSETRKADDAVEFQELKAQIEESQRQLSNLSGLVLEGFRELKELLQRLARSKNFQDIASATKTASEFGFHLRDLVSNGVPLRPEWFGERMIELVARGRHARITREKTQSRSMGVADLFGGNYNPNLRSDGLKSAHIEVDSLEIGDSLQFSIRSPISGFLTVINAGTCGRFILLAPNAYVETSKISAEAEIDLPGPEVLPVERLSGDKIIFVELGPIGFDYLLVFITPEPIWTPEQIRNIRRIEVVNHEGKPVGRPGPFCYLSDNQIAELESRLAGWSGRWVPGASKVYVQPK